MAALTAASWTVTVTKRTLNANSRERKTHGTIVLAGTDTYPTAGIPLPAKGLFGMVRELDQLTLVGQAGGTTQYLTNYDKSTNKLLVYEEEAAAAGGPLLEADTAEVPGPRTWQFVATGW